MHIREDVETHHTSGEANWLSLFRDRNLFERLWRASLLQFMAQMCGATAMKYYLPTLFAKLGLPTRVTLLAGGIESTLKIGMTIIEMFLIDHLGRRVTLTAGCLAMGVSMLVSRPSLTRALFTPLVFFESTQGMCGIWCMLSGMWYVCD